MDQGALRAIFFVHLYSNDHSTHPEGWAPSAGGFPAMTEKVAFLLKDLVLLTMPVYLLKLDMTSVMGASDGNKLTMQINRAA